MTDPTIHAFDDDRYPVTSLDGRDAQPAAGSSPLQVFAAMELMPGGVQDTGEHRGAGQRGVSERKRPRRSRRAFGTVERLPSGRFRARVIGPQGRYVSAPATFPNRTDAARWVDVQHADLVRGTWQAPVKPAASPSVAGYVSRWIEEHPNARDSTKELYRGLLRTCIAPTLGRASVSGLTPAAVRRWHHQLGERLAADAERRRTALQAKGRKGSAASVRDGGARQAQAYRLLRAAMTTAVGDGMLRANPCTISSAGTPRRAVGRSRPVTDRLLSPAQVADAAAAMPPRYRGLVLMAAWSGLRQGELLALTRADLDLAASPARVMVRKAVRRADTGQVRLDVPKTPSSVRTVTLPDPLTEALRAHLAAFVPAESTALLFTTGTGTTPARSNLGATWRRACATAGVPQVRLHDLRHVAQVFAAEAGATLPELMGRLGHATPAAAMVYLHARTDRECQLAAALGQAMLHGGASAVPGNAVGD
jgi:integrase